MRPVHTFRALAVTSVLAIALNPGSTPSAKANTAACIPPPTGITSWWPGEGSAADVAGFNTGALQGAVNFPAGVVGTAFQFTADDQRVVVPHELSLNIAASGFTLSFWVRGNKNDPGPGIKCMIEKSHGTTDLAGWAFQVDAATGRPRFAIGTGTAFPEIVGTADILDGSWHHVAGTWGGGTSRLYVDGTAQGTIPVTSPKGNTRALNMGFWWGNGTPSRFFRGALDEVVLFNRELSGTEIAAIGLAGGGGFCAPSFGCPDPVVSDVSATVPEPGDPKGRPQWVHTNVFVRPGEVLTIVAAGDFNDGGTFSGGPDGSWFPGDPLAAFPDWYEQIAHGALIGRLRLALDPSQVVPLDDGTDPNGISGPGYVGSAFSMAVTQAGWVELSINDGDTGNNSGSFRAWICPSRVLGVGAGSSAGPLAVHPNPGRGAQWISWSLARPGLARVQVLDLAGRLVRTLVDERCAAGPRVAAWDGTANDGRRMGPGVYMIRLQSPDGEHTLRALRLR